MADDQGSGALQITLHPLVIINISDHFTRGRTQAAADQPAPRVFGVLIGAQTGRHVEIANSFEIKVVDGGAPQALPPLRAPLPEAAPR